jgi:predicted DNA-binding protein YlxM (UPF0122 family)
MKKDEILEEIAGSLSSISDSLERIDDELDEISMVGKMLVFFKMVEIRPELKDKLGPLINELVDSMDMSMTGEPEND